LATRSMRSRTELIFQVVRVNRIEIVIPACACLAPAGNDGPRAEMQTPQLFPVE
jgi:hypothetical protein